MNVKSMWEATTIRKKRPQVQDTIHCDVVIIGAGYTGLSTAYHLQKLGQKAVVLEKHDIGFGASGRNGGELLTGFQGTMADWVKKKGYETARQMWQLSLDSIDLVEKLIKDNELDCDFVRQGDLRPAYKKSHLDNFKRERDYLAEHFNFHDMSVLDKNEMQAELKTDFYHGARVNERGAHFHPLKFALGLADLVEKVGGKVYEQSAAKTINRKQDHVVVVTEKGKIIAREVVYAMNAYADNIDKTMKRTVIPIESIMIATEPVPESLLAELIPNNRAVSDSKNLLYYFRRTADNRMAFGGSGRSFSKKEALRLFDILREGMVEVFPALSSVKVTHRWGGKVGFTKEMQPHIGQLENGAHYAFGYCGRGAAMGVMAGKLLADTVLNSNHALNPLKKAQLKPIPLHEHHAKGVGLMKLYMTFQDKYVK